MGTFELGNENVLGAVQHSKEKIKEECIIALKVYDHCRQQECKIVSQSIFQSKKFRNADGY